MRFRQRLLLLAVMACCLPMNGCSRRHYRLHTDADAFGLVDQKSAGTPWQLPSGYSIYPRPDSRLADPTDPDFPLLPSPGPILYSRPTPAAGDDAESLPTPAEDIPPDPPTDDELLELLPSAEASPPEPPDLWRTPSVLPVPRRPDDSIQLASFTQDDVRSWSRPTDEYGEPTTELAIQPIPTPYWRVLPASCLQHMLEFDSVQEEYDKTFGEESEEATQRPARRLSLREIMRLAVENSREYQTEEERLYVAALDVSLQRYDYALKFTPTGNGVDLLYNHVRTDGELGPDSLSFPNRWGVQKRLARGGNLVAQFANDVVLNFNGAGAVSTRVSSDLLFGFTQSILQRDIQLDPLIQAERDLVYAARLFARYRKEFFFGVADQYYQILKTYRSLEIDSQNYFSLVRTVEQATAEVRAAVKNAPNQVAVDQFEQSMLSGRSNLIATSNRLEFDLDQLKLEIGLPTDMPIDLNLNELEQLSLLDELEVAVERVSRWGRRVEEQRNRSPLSRVDLVNAGIYMIERLFEWAELKQTYDGQVTDLSELEQLYSQLQLEQAHNEEERNARDYRDVTSGDVREPTILVYLRATVLLDARLRLIDRQLQRLTQDPLADSLQTERVREQWRRAVADLQASREALARAPSDEQLDEMLEQLRPMLRDTDQLAIRLDGALQYDRNRPAAVRDQQAVEAATRLLRLSDQVLTTSGSGLPNVDIDVNDAMLTALIQRLDLMNERGGLADDWRRIKFAADDLRSVLNLSSSYRLSTDPDKNRAFEFDDDDSATRIGLTFDLPLNRRAQRNAYRRSLIAYQQGRRGVMQLEDNIKFQIRNGLRTLELTRVQYPIRVTQAALAAEQVISIRLQLALGTPNVRGTDLLDALQGSREALTAVANLRINYLVDRSRFVLDLELMQLDDDGFWPSINDPDYQPEPDLLYPPTAGPTYGEIPPYVKPSKLMYHLYRHPRPGEQIEVITRPPAP